MGLYIIRRLGFLVVLIIGVSLMVFIISHMVPSDPVVVHLSKRNLNNPKMVAAFKEKWGLDKPLHIQYLIYLKKLCQLDMGVSIKTKRPVIEDLKRYLPATVEMASLGVMFAVVVGMIFGVISAVRRNSATDQVVRALSVSGIAIPNFWISLVVLYIFYYKLGWAPGPGRLSPLMDPPATVTGLYTIDALLQGDAEVFWNALHHLILPSLVLGLFTMGLITRTTRSSLLETLSMDYIRTARAKGLTEQMIVIKHALGNALIPVITVIGLGFSNLLGGTVLVETIFGWPGIGMYAYKSATSLDFPAIIGVALLLAVNFVVINLIIDLLYGVIDPRVRYS
jgi:peptide/nickel transport system permease protein